MQPLQCDLVYQSCKNLSVDPLLWKNLSGSGKLIFCCVLILFLTCQHQTRKEYFFFLSGK